MLFYIRVFAVCAVDNSCQNAFLRINKIELRVLYVEFSAQGLDNRIYKVCIFISIQICWCTGKCSFNKMLQIFGENIYGIILGNQFLANIRECDAILHVLRCFDDGNVVHVDGSVDPVRDKEVVDLELQIKDLETVESRLSKAEKAGKAGDKEAKKLADLLIRYKAALEQGKSCRSVVPANEEEAAIARDLFLLTNKPVLYVCNVDDASALNGNKYVDAVREAVKDEQAEILIISARTEAEIAEIEDYDDRQMFLQEMGLEEAGVIRLIQSAYHLLGLQTFFTAGADECRAWTIHKGDKAPKAAGVIHSDFEKGFIRAEVIKYDDYIQYGSEAAVREAGKLNVEGKEYVVQDGDIMHFRFNV